MTYIPSKGNKFSSHHYSRSVRVILTTFSILLFTRFNRGEAKCGSGCGIALASYNVWQGCNLSYIGNIFGRKIQDIVPYNPRIRDSDSIKSDTRINVPFSCECLNGDFLGHTFQYETVVGDTYHKIATLAFANLTDEYWLKRVNRYGPNDIPNNVAVNVTVNCSCGDGSVSEDYGLFLTYPLLPGDNLSVVAKESGVPAELLRRFNPGSDSASGSGIVFVPAKDQTGNYPPLKKSSSGGISAGAIAGITIGSVFGVMSLAACSYFIFHRTKKIEEESFLQTTSDEHSTNEHVHGPANLIRTSESGPLIAATSPRPTGITVDKSVEFSYEELAKSTNKFSLATKIGQGGFGSVFYGELRGEKAAIKKMDMQASKEFLAELKVLTHVHHLNLVRLIGYCVEGSLFLVYEYIENGNLSQHLRGTGRNPLPWSTRVQIALDSARGLEYIHEHTVPVYIHRDIKSANILIDKDYRAKVADFGLTKLTEVGSNSLHTRLVGTFGYMPPEYAQYGDVSPKIDVYAFGVVLYELISAKEAILKTNEVDNESMGLVALFEDVLDHTDPTEGICKVIDPRLGDDYPLDSVCKMARLAKACTHENPQLRPSMRSIVVALMTLSSSTEDWDIGSFYENQGLVHLMSGR